MVDNPRIYKVFTKEEGPRLRYTIDYINRHPLTPKGHQLLLVNNALGASFGYGNSSDHQLRTIPALGQYFKEDRLPGPKDPWPLKWDMEADKVPFDVFEAIFFLISRYEEVWADEINEQGWLLESKHVLIQHNQFQSPLVDQWIRELWSWVTLVPVEKQKTSYSLSHDIDVLYRFRPAYKMLRTVSAAIYHRRGWSHLRRTLGLMKDYVLRHQNDPYDVYDWLITDKSGFSSKTLYLMMGGETAHDNLYSPQDQALQDIIDTARGRGYTIGIHPSYNAALDRRLLEQEILTHEQVTGQHPIKSRQHWLRWFWDKTPDMITKSPIIQDSSMGYSRHIGFRCGTGFAYHMYDFKKEQAYTWIEQPLAIMESALIHQADGDPVQLDNILYHFIDSNPYNTHLEMNWHNSNFDLSMWYGHNLTRLYRDVILKL